MPLRFLKGFRNNVVCRDKMKCFLYRPPNHPGWVMEGIPASPTEQYGLGPVVAALGQAICRTPKGANRE
jgi:hypothetical protein